MVTGPRTLETAMMLIQMTAGIALGVPCFFSDGFSYYYSDLIEHYHRISVVEALFSADIFILLPQEADSFPQPESEHWAHEAWYNDPRESALYTDYPEIQTHPIPG